MIMKGIFQTINGNVQNRESIKCNNLFTLLFTRNQQESRQKDKDK